MLNKTFIEREEYQEAVFKRFLSLRPQDVGPQAGDLLGKD